MPDHSIRVEQVMELEGRSRAWVFEHAERLGAHRNGVVGRNGKPVTLYDIRRCSPEAYRKWELQKAAVPLLPTENSSPEETSPAQLAMEMTIPGGPRMSAADREVVNFRFQVIEPLVDRRKHWQIWRFCSDSAVEVVKHQAARHKRTVHKTGEQRPLSWRTVYDWWQRYRGQKFSDRSGLEALVDRSRRDKGCKRKLNEAGQDFIVAMVLPFWDGKDGYGELSAADVHAAYNEELAWREEHAGTVLQAEDRKRLKKYCSPIGRLSKSALLPHIHYETVRKVIAALPKSLLVRARSGPERFEATQVAYSYRAIEKLAPMEYVVMDHRRADLFCAVRSGKGETGGWELIRPWITAAIDMRTRKWLGWRIVRTPSAGSIASVMKRVFLDHGLPQSFYWDNGQDFECFWLDGVLKDLGIPVTHAKVKNARAKVIEPNFKPLAAWERTTPWWGGHKPSARPERLADRVREFEQWLKGKRRQNPFPTFQEVQKHYGKLFRKLNDRPMKGALGMRKVIPSGYGWMSPEECWSELIGSVTRRSIPLKTLLFLFRDKREVKIKHGQVKISYHGQPFIYKPAADADPLALYPYNDRVVELAIDKLDLETVAVFHDGHLICLADNMELRGMREEQFKEDEQERRRGHRLFREMTKAAHSELGVASAVDRLDRPVPGVAQTPEAERPQVTEVYPEAERAVAAIQSRRCAFSQVSREIQSAEPENDSGTEFDFFGN